MSDFLGLPKTEYPSLPSLSDLPSIKPAEIRLPTEMKPSALKLDLKDAACNLQVGESAPGMLQALASSLSNAIQKRTEAWAIEATRKREVENARLLQDIRADVYRGNWKQGLSKLERLGPITPPWEPLLLKAFCLAGLDRLEDALRLVGEGVRRCDDQEIREAFSSLQAQLHSIMDNRLLIQGQQYMLAGMFGHAISAFEEFLRQKGQRADVLYVKAICHSNLNDMESARKACQQALSCSPPVALERAVRNFMTAIDAAAIMGSAQQAMQNGQFAGALRFLQDKRLANDALARVLAAVCHIRLGQKQEAETILRQIEMADHSPETAQLVSVLREQLASAGIRAVFEQGVGAMQRQEWAEAARLFERVESMTGPSAESEPVLQFYVAAARFRAGNLSGARTALDRARRNSTDKKLNQQLDQMKEVLVREEDQAPMRAVVNAMNQRDWENALRELGSVLRLKPKDPVGYFYKALCHLNTAGELMERDQRRAREHYVNGLSALSSAESNCGWKTDKQVKQAIANLRAQVGG
jgi:tetratricopeptide (TPR) repeat protein